MLGCSGVRSHEKQPDAIAGVILDFAITQKGCGLRNKMFADEISHRLECCPDIKPGK